MPNIIIDEKELCWMAGFFDGEGSILLGRGKSKKGLYYYRKVSVANTRYDILEIFKLRFEGKIIHNKTQSINNKNCKEMYFWTVSSNQAEIFVNTIYPYLKLKKIQAELFIEFSKLIPERGGGPGRNLKEEDIYSRNAVIDKLHLVNKRGRNVTQFYN